LTFNNRQLYFTGMENVIKTIGIATVAEAAGVSYEAARKWARSGEIPSDRLSAVVRATGVAPWVLAPRLYQSLADAELRYMRLRTTQSP